MLPQQLGTKTMTMKKLARLQQEAASKVTEVDLISAMDDEVTQIVAAEDMANRQDRRSLHYLKSKIGASDVRGMTIKRTILFVKEQMPRAHFAASRVTSNWRVIRNTWPKGNAVNLDDNNDKLGQLQQREMT